MQSYVKHHTYGFRFKGEHQQRVAGLHAIGKEKQTEESYSWDGLQRAEHGRIVFQYTLDGRGAIRIGETIHRLEKGDAFFVKIPSNHCYYLPEGSSHWAFVFITLYGDEVNRQYQRITEAAGHISHLPLHSRPIKHIFRLLDIIETTGIQHGYDASAYAYSFLMEYLQYVEYEERQEADLPVAVAKAVTFIEKNYAADIGLDDIVAISGLSKYHFTRLFSKYFKQTPIQFLTKVRIKRALELLQHTENSIEEIAFSVGYASSNYFTKVFKQLLHETPSAYRQSKSVMPVDRLFID
ncbi:AraC family transcriptional regulator [Gracilibacillus caseinilyticus]|uniref:AraC family transcriptional regulator n=1 Tax=Gracilibacillus caseinilyticus TaxID=2932256 RepID=A0ABY4F0E7_9BACI|nr:AraC family transcriptional regulator [Gracilibacillus caseinilyticus]UOQ50137.1 AraC family transcriptional regulator [Gracilibacillus caseinilyticus]